MDIEKIYFPNLNGLRFIAAFLVIIHHTEQLKSVFKLNSYWNTIPAIQLVGKLGVVLFFVLSGFLITYLLLAEEKAQKRISIKAFYIRRILRIWPLYFLIIFLAFWILPTISIFSIPGFGIEIVNKYLIWKIILFVILFPNLVLSVFGVIPYASHTWSIGTEEQYYLIWPVILKKFKNHRIVSMFLVIFLYLFIKAFLTSSFSDFTPYKLIIKGFWSAFNIDCMAIGGLFAILLFEKNKYLKIFLNKYFFYSILILTSTLIIKGVFIPYILFEFYAVLFGIIILNFAANDQIRISLENRVLNYLGRISYGLYMYQPIAIVLALYIVKLLNLTTNWVIYPLVFIITISFAGFSYRYFESIFLRFKVRFSKIVSGENSN